MMFSTLRLLTIIVPTLIFITSTPATATVQRSISRSAYDEECNQWMKCDKGAWLACIDSKCQCMLPQEMIYHPEKSKCLSKAGERCKFSVNKDVSSSLISHYEISDCIPNSHCNNEGMCGCDKTFYETINGTCVSQGKFNEPCTSSYECRSDKYLFCMDNGICGCANKSLIYDPSQEKCVGKAGLELQVSDACVTGAKLQNKRCVCTDAANFYPDLDGKCNPRKLLGEPCLSNEECMQKNKYFECVDGTCSCNPKNSRYRVFTKVIEVKKKVKCGRYDSHREGCQRRYYDSVVYGEYTVTEKESQAYSQCVGLADGPCNSDKNCVEYATCNSFNRCFCNNNYKRTTKGTCGLSYGGKCSKTSDCSDVYMCTNGICTCPDPLHQKYNEKTKSCESIVRGSCTQDSDCVSNSECIFNPNYGYQECRCKTEYVENSDGQCDLAHGAQCDYEQAKDKCDQVGGLQCRNGKCACPNGPSSYFDITSRKCLKRVGSRCGKSLECVTNANCFQSIDEISGVCKCNEGYAVTVPDRLCKEPINGLTTTIINDIEAATIKLEMTTTVDPFFSDDDIQDEENNRLMDEDYEVNRDYEYFKK